MYCVQLKTHVFDYDFLFTEDYNYIFEKNNSTTPEGNDYLDHDIKSLNNMVESDRCSVNGVDIINYLNGKTTFIKMKFIAYDYELYQFYFNNEADAAEFKLKFL